MDLACLITFSFSNILKRIFSFFLLMSYTCFGLFVSNTSNKVPLWACFLTSLDISFNSEKWKYYNEYIRSYYSSKILPNCIHRLFLDNVSSVQIVFQIVSLLSLFSFYLVCFYIFIFFHMQKQPPRDVLKKRCSWKYAANSQENTHAEVRFQ